MTRTTHTRTLAMRNVLVALVVLATLVPSAPARAHQDYSLAPNARSPWRSATTLTTHYNEGTHRDYYNGMHTNAHHALDLARWCGAALYGMYDNMRVTAANPTTGTLKMEGSPGGRRIQVAYLHMDTIAVATGATVHSWTYLGTEGTRVEPGGSSSGCHLHVAVHSYSSWDARWYSIRPQICGREVPHNHAFRAIASC